MKKSRGLKIVGLFLSTVILILIFIALYLKFYLPNIEVKDLKIEITQDRIAKGEYLANSVLVCTDCHSKRDWSKFSGPIVPGTEGMGGEVFNQKMGLPGEYVASNITPYYLKSWSDGEIYRAITSGVGKNNNALFPIMPYWAYGTLDEEDIYCVIAYLRSLPSIENTPSTSKSNFPFNFLINTMPKEGHSRKRPSNKESLNYGEYIVRAAGCIDCHTPADDKGELIMAKAFEGGREFPMEESESLASSNITFDKETGIGNWSKKKFIKKFKHYDLSYYKPKNLKTGDNNTVMPWTMYAKMDTTDLEAIYNYLKSLQPIEN